MLNRNNCKIGYIRYNDRKYERFKDKIANIVRRIFIKVIIENIDNGIIILIPKYKFIKSTNKFVRKRIINQIKKYIKYENMQYIILDKDLSFIEENLRFIKEEFNKINILNGKYLMKNIISKLLEYIYNVNNKNIKLENIYIFVNEYTKNNIGIIEMLARKCKTVNIVTENLKYFIKLEDFLYNEGILITVSNNKRKSAKNAKIIINMDFSKDVFEKYTINMNSIIINLTNEKSFFENTFRGVCINNIEISIDKNVRCFYKEFYGNIKESLYLESIILNKDYKYVENKYEENNSKISDLIGVRGKIQKNEFCESIDKFLNLI